MKNWIKIKDFSAIGFSLLLHVIILAAMGIYHFDIIKMVVELEIDSVVTDEREQYDFSKTLDIQTDVAVVNNQTIGGNVGASPGGAEATMKAPPKKPEQKTEFKKTERPYEFNDYSAPGVTQIAKSLGNKELSGETGAVVAGYGAALSRLTQELLRLLHEDRLLVVWLFDESESMKDDQKEIADNFHKVIQNWDLPSLQKKKKRGSKRNKSKSSDAPLITSIIGYGETVHPLTKKPTADVNLIRSAIGKISIDKSGKEMMCSAILKSISEYTRLATSQKRKLVFIVVTDESGDDGDLLESVIDKAKRFRAPVYILGREAVFGYTHARIRWRDPQYGLSHWLKINRGPETAYVECLQWDGLRDRYDVQQSGFGPYEQVRLAKETGGIFFVLPRDERNLISTREFEKRKFDFLDMKEYQPLLLPRRDYAKARSNSKKFRNELWNVIVTLNPNDDNPLPHYDEALNLREYYFSGDIEKFKKDASTQVKKAARSLELLDKAISILDKAEQYRSKEDSQRWRASYDLLRAQCFAYRVRLFQYLLAMDDHVYKNPAFKNKKNNSWNVRRTTRLLKPDEPQYRRLMGAFKLRMLRVEYLEQMDKQMQEATKRYRFVMNEHPGTPWARRANAEMRQGFGISFVEYFRDPRYGKLKIKLPKF